ncbi:Tm-1-like ATP-binding domain-containing protein [Tuwongella immobilis]|uniref:Uncharacterized protein n=1 Tax=Tuwongella immobilis TaxID=692036 RepID=A0A6C2YY08_9BACT|nr:Tm-1-like ATP-binding domain-containing protein [Tuwongella immobilis]VIP05635.1 Uncharacterized protein OS=Pirellula staleyi (strain ATCC 27377 / DSM 6068 / ICPB 4128) GN=Psta_2898 PE=4 SV=1: UPF0261 [Tuwongella immobilis]VTS08626.1 Uncharacterized protein OS=Pirellula staleyi (strain ATCC 27377 / DSM 6068 / ICPB 4128) GN=Psta_2898 PE=4 SV=1: UPF0261 [Tuwongella immobilis]
MPVLLIGTLDTKGDELGFVRDRLQEAGIATLVVDVGSLNPPRIVPDLTREEVFRAAKTTLAEIQRQGDRGHAVTQAAAGITAIAKQFAQQGQLDGILALGGSAGTTIGTAAMRALPYGIPKIMVSTLASGQVSPFVGVRDIVMMHSVVDISGLNRLSKLVLGNAAQAMAGMVRAASETRRRAEADPKPLITATMFGVTTPCVEAGRAILESHGYEVLTFHATGVGGRTMEALIHDGLITGVLDVTTTELADELVGGVLTAGRDRLTAAAMKGIPQVISVGALDMVNFGPRATVPEKFRDRRFYQHNENITLMRTTPEENDQLGKEIAEKACAASGPTTIVLPLRGVSAIDAEGKPFWWPEADQALFQSIRNWISSDVKLVELDLHINDPAFATAITQELLTQLRKG